MQPAQFTVLLWVALGGFVVSALAINRLLGRLPPSRDTRIIARILQACCGLGAMLCLAGLAFTALR